ncbi:MAG: iron-sulfur cluster assembly accessory protein [Solirubrobacteraceae bacterium]|jgi:iron-sulfur cluster assembly protein|nr:iron-sulfur cluster assembly accessory protein [Solirubrobacteraceae bacterium]
MTDSLTITDACAERLHELLAAERAAGPQAGLRVDVVPGGCSGYQYRLALDEWHPDDVVVEHDGVRVFTALENVPFIRGAAIDHRPDGFHIDNPNVVYGCGCGNSFQLREDAATAV